MYSHLLASGVRSAQEGTPRLKHLIANWEKLRTAAAECADIARRASEPQKREFFTLLAGQLERLASEIEQVITLSVSVGSRH